MKEKKIYETLGLYVHIPFCRHKCAYCDFYSTDRQGDDGKSDEMKQYCKALRYHLRMVSDKVSDYNIDSVFIGGGTPPFARSSCFPSSMRSKTIIMNRKTWSSPWK